MPTGKGRYGRESEPVLPRALGVSAGSGGCVRVVEIAGFDAQTYEGRTRRIG